MSELTEAQATYIKTLHAIVDPVDAKNMPHHASIAASQAEIANNETPESRQARRELERLERKAPRIVARPAPHAAPKESAK